MDRYGVYHGQMPLGAVTPFEYSNVYRPYDENSNTRMVLAIKDNAIRYSYESGDFVISVMALDISAYDYQGGRVGLFVWSHAVDFTNFLVGDLASVTDFCNGGICDDRTGRCLTQPTFNPTERAGEVVLPDICPGAVDGFVDVDVTSLDAFTLVDMAPISGGPCAWSTSAAGLAQTSTAFGNAPGDNTMMGCVALAAGTTYTDFMVEMTATFAGGNDGWGFVFGYDNAGHYLATVNNDEFPVNAADGVSGPFAKITATNGNPCLEVMDNETNCYDTLSYADASNFIVDGELVTDLPGEYARKYPYTRKEDWPAEKTMTLIVKDGSARLMMFGKELDLETPVNNLRQPTKYVSTWSYDLGGNYDGGAVGIFTYAQALTISSMKITDLSASMPTAFCGGQGTCASGVCTQVAASDVCEDPVGDDYDVATDDLEPWEFIEDPFLNQGCSWTLEDFGRGPNLYQGSNAQAIGNDYRLLGCNAILKSEDYTDFIMQMDMDNFDNDGVGFVFGWQSETDHWKIHKVNDPFWPNPADSVLSPAMKIIKRRGEFSCGAQPMNSTNDCYETVAFADVRGIFHQATGDYSVAPWQYSDTYVDYGIGNGDLATRMVLIIKDNAIRTYFQSPESPAKKVALMAHDISAYGYQGGRVGLFAHAHQVQFWKIQIAPLSTPEAPTQFCNGTKTCNTQLGLCE